MPGLDPGIFLRVKEMPGSSPGMTNFPKLIRRKSK